MLAIWQPEKDLARPPSATLSTSNIIADIWMPMFKRCLFKHWHSYSHSYANVWTCQCRLLTFECRYLKIQTLACIQKLAANLWSGAAAKYVRLYPPIFLSLFWNRTQKGRSKATCLILSKDCFFVFFILGHYKPV